VIRMPNSRFSRFRKRITFANVTSMIALFVALGGTSYAAATLPNNSVGKSQIRANAVGKSEAATNSIGKTEILTGAVGRSEIATDGVGASEVKKDAIDSDEIADGGLQAADLSDAAKTAINGVKFHSAVTAAGAQSAGNAKAVTHTATSGLYVVDLGTDVSACQVAATITDATPGFIRVTSDAANKNVVTVNTAAVGGADADRAFNLIVAC
jgi:hypothetical protein